MKQGSTVNIHFINDKEMLRIGKQYKGKNYPTDVLTFNYSKDKDAEVYGEIYVNIDAAKRQCKDNKNTVKQEIAFLVQHAMLHMQGVHHKGDGI